MIMEKVIRSLVYHINELPNKGTFLLVAANHFPEILIANYGGVVRELTEVRRKKVTAPHRKKPLPMCQLASPVTEWAAPAGPVIPQLCPRTPPE